VQRSRRNGHAPSVIDFGSCSAHGANDDGTFSGRNGK